MTWEDMAKLLAYMAVFDSREGGDLDIDAWFDVAQQQGWHDPSAVRRVIAEHYGRPLADGEQRRRIDAAMISTRLREIRRKAMDSFVDPKLPDSLPPGMTYPEWLRSQQEAHKAEALRVWALTGAEPRPGAIEPMGSRLPEILANAPEHVRPALEASMTQVERRRA